MNNINVNVACDFCKDFIQTFKFDNVNETCSDIIEATKQLKWEVTQIAENQFTFKCPNCYKEE